MRRLPPLKALRAFEAAGRHESLKQAADELHVTTGAVSQQVKLLEEFLGVDLFKRLNKSVRLTEAGRAALPLIESGFELLNQAVTRAQEFGNQNLITISVAPSFGAKWLLPRLELFRKAHPDIDLRVDASTRLVDFSYEDVDLAIRYGPPKERGMHLEALTDEIVFPVCSPRLLERGKVFRQPQDLAGQTLLHFEGRADDREFPGWGHWLGAAGVASLEVVNGPRFSMSSMVLQAAMDGQGIALGSSVLAADDLRAGRLVRLFDVSVQAQHSYYLICTRNTLNRPDIQRFVQWIKQEMTAGQRDSK
ncbi:LysR family transcriptional regulator [Marinobacterium aestuarii]|uniref:LysR family transcriptional regulator n=1 Tax=Marinobacterium aestuarii TaxID=1821621 RepID=A0A1A9F3I5_9GAMM|nr:transcriptional regulator GcvA [Marinobacterium aestuarii]ANG64329.1 LysR family transcriptional regulator [Marinobacterium aestuarii]